MEANFSVSQNPRRWLHGEFMARKRNNRSYSLRSFAGKLGLSPATLSGILSGKRRLTRKSGRQIAERLNLSPKDRSELLKAISRKGPADTVAPDEVYRTIEVETFQLISQWYHYAILSLSELPQAKADGAWIAQKLGILRKEAEQALERLKRLGIIEEKDGRYRQVAPPLTTADTMADPGIRNHSLQYLQKAEAALDLHPPENLAYYTVVMAADPNQISKARSSMKAFRRNLSEVMEQGKKSRVYALSMQLFPVDTYE